MNKKIVFLVNALILLVSHASSLTFNGVARASSSIIRVPEDYETIQAAINEANLRDTVFVASGIYYEHVIINKTLSLVGESRETTIIDGNGTGIVVKITASNVNFTGFTVRRSGQKPWADSGIFISFGSVNNNVSHNIVVNNYHGIYVEFSTNNVISSNNVSLNTGRGIFLDSSSGNVVSENLVSRNEQDNGIELFDSNNNIISANTLSANGWAGIYLEKSEGNSIVANVVSNNSLTGIYLEESSNNILYHNNFIYNGLGEEGQLYSSASSNVWDNGAEGNYWSDYAGEDLNGDGIGDTDIPHLGVDSFPLIEPWRSLRTFFINGDVVTVLSNSTIASFDFNQSLARISFTATGSSGTLGFCNVTVPKNLLKSEPPIKIWTVTVDGVFTSFTPTENTTHTSLYFTYAHTTRKIRIEVVTLENVPPKADFSFSPIDPTPYDIISFVDTSTDSDGTVVSWYWKFGDGASSTEQNPQHKYAVADTYTVTLKVTDNLGAETETSKAILVRKVETNMTVIAPSVANQGELFTITVILKDEDQNPVPNATIGVYYLFQEEWKTIGLDKTNTSGVISIQHTPLLAAGTYPFKAVFNGTQILAESSSVFMIEIAEVIDVVPPTADAGQDQTVYVGTLLTFNASGSTDNIGIVSYHWNFGDGNTGIGMITNHTYTSSGTYNVTLTVRDAAGNTDSDSITVTVLSTETLPIWIMGLTLGFLGTIAVIAVFLWKRRK
jgi:parallel beta-helix repeat protein